MNKQSGFTLIELVVVIIILGILAATAVPKFVDLQSDARVSALKGLKGALESAATLTYSRAAIDGKQNALSGEDIDGVNIVYGYPAATKADLEEAAGLSEIDWEIIPGTSTSAKDSAYITFSNSSVHNFNSTCKVVYKEASKGNRPQIWLSNGYDTAASPKDVVC